MINEETRKYFHHSREKKSAGRAAGPTPSSTTAASVDGMYDEVNALAAEKVALSGRLVKLFERAMARLQHDLGRIVELQGDETGPTPAEKFLDGVERTVLRIRDLQAAAVQGSALHPSRCVFLRVFLSCAEEAEDNIVGRQRQGIKLGVRRVWPSQHELEVQTVASGPSETNTRARSECRYAS